MNQKSEKNYVVAVCLSGIFGVLGIHHFYLGRYTWGVFDLGLSLFALYLFLSGHFFAALLVFAIDFTHTIIVTFMLFTGQVKDGNGDYVCYPGQVLK